MRDYVNGISITERADQLKTDRVPNAAQVLADEYDLKIGNAERYIYQARNRNWRDDPATSKQIEYIVALNVNIDGMTLTKGQASTIIDAAKNGTIGSLGMFYNGGSN